MPVNQNSTRLDLAQAGHVPGTSIADTARKFGVNYDSLRERIYPRKERGVKGANNVQDKPVTGTPAITEAQLYETFPDTDSLVWSLSPEEFERVKAFTQRTNELAKLAGAGAVRNALYGCWWQYVDGLVNRIG